MSSVVGSQGRGSERGECRRAPSKGDEKESHSEGTTIPWRPVEVACQQRERQERAPRWGRPLLGGACCWRRIDLSVIAHPLARMPREQGPLSLMACPLRSRGRSRLLATREGQRWGRWRRCPVRPRRMPLGPPGERRSREWRSSRYDRQPTLLHGAPAAPERERQSDCVRAKDCTSCGGSAGARGNGPERDPKCRRIRRATSGSEIVAMEWRRPPKRALRRTTRAKISERSSALADPAAPRNERAQPSLRSTVVTPTDPMDSKSPRASRPAMTRWGPSLESRLSWKATGQPGMR